MLKRTVIIDCDPGVDDAFALFYALAQEEFHIPLITTVSGNVNVDITTENARRIVAMAGCDVEVAKGANRPLIGEPFFASYIHGANGLGNYQFVDDCMAPLSDRSAVAALYDHIMNSEDKVIVVPIGPLTNIATLFLMYPEVIERIEYLSIMGGGLKGGNTTACAEFNFFVDPEAARIVFESGVRIVMAGLDVTEQAFVDKSHLSAIASTSDVGKFLSEVIVLARRQNSVDFRTSLHDVVSVMFIKHPEYFEFENLNIKIETKGDFTRGMSVADRRLAFRELGEVSVLLGINHSLFFAELLKGLESYV